MTGTVGESNTLSSFVRHTVVSPFMHLIALACTTLMAASEVTSDSFYGISGIKLTGQPTPTDMQAFGIKFSAHLPQSQVSDRESDGFGAAVGGTGSLEYQARF